MTLPKLEKENVLFLMIVVLVLAGIYSRRSGSSRVTQQYFLLAVILGMIIFYYKVIGESDSMEGFTTTVPGGMRFRRKSGRYGVGGGKMVEKFSTMTHKDKNKVLEKFENNNKFINITPGESTTRVKINSNNLKNEISNLERNILQGEPIIKLNYVDNQQNPKTIEFDINNSRFNEIAMKLSSILMPIMKDINATVPEETKQQIINKISDELIQNSNDNPNFDPNDPDLIEARMKAKKNTLDHRTMPEHRIKSLTLNKSSYNTTAAPPLPNRQTNLLNSKQESISKPDSPDNGLRPINLDFSRDEDYAHQYSTDFKQIEKNTLGSKISNLFKLNYEKIDDLSRNATERDYDFNIVSLNFDENQPISGSSELPLDSDANGLNENANTSDTKDDGDNGESPSTNVNEDQVIGTGKVGTVKPDAEGFYNIDLNDSYKVLRKNMQNPSIFRSSPINALYEKYEEYYPYFISKLTKSDGEYIRSLFEENFIKMTDELNKMKAVSNDMYIRNYIDITESSRSDTTEERILVFMIFYLYYYHKIKSNININILKNIDLSKFIDPRQFIVLVMFHLAIKYGYFNPSKSFILNINEFIRKIKNKQHTKIDLNINDVTDIIDNIIAVLSFEYENNKLQDAEFNRVYKESIKGTNKVSSDTKSPKVNDQGQTMTKEQEEITNAVLSGMTQEEIDAMTDEEFQKLFNEEYDRRVEERDQTAQDVADQTEESDANDSIYNRTFKRVENEMDRSGLSGYINNFFTFLNDTFAGLLG
jgi:hypothetical protein